MSMEVVKAEIETVDAQESLSGGVIVLVTGHLTGRQDGVRREFTQTFFLAPQEKGFFVLNDLFRYTGASVIPVAEHHDASAAPHVHAAGEVLANGTAVHYPSEHGMFFMLFVLVPCLIYLHLVNKSFLFRLLFYK